MLKRGRESDYLAIARFHCVWRECFLSSRVSHGQREVPGPGPSNVGAIFLRRQVGVYSVFMEGRGIYRERNGWGTQHSVRVKYDEHQELDISEDRYRARGYQPPFDQLPWKDESANDNA